MEKAKMIENALTYPGISNMDKIVYAYILATADRYPSSFLAQGHAEDIADKVGIQVRQAKDSLSALKREGMIAIYKVKGESPTMQIFITF